MLVSLGLSIGEFSRVTHLSVKTLRHYHDVGLLEPSFVNPGNGYRYYAEGQVALAQVIRRLRDLEMPIAEVKAVVHAADGASRNALIAAHLDRLETELARTREAVSSLRNLITRPHVSLAVAHRTVRATPAIAIQAIVDRDDVLAWWHGALGELQAMVRAQDLEPTGPSGGLFDSGLYQHDRGEATIFIPIGGAAHPAGRVEQTVVPDAELAVVTHHGSLADIDVTYGELGCYASTHELSIDGPLREAYIRNPQNTANESDWETEIGWPIFRADPDPAGED